MLQRLRSLQGFATRVLKNQPWNENPSYQETAAEGDWNRREVEHARTTTTELMLIVAHGIDVKPSSSGSLRGSGGRHRAQVLHSPAAVSEALSW